MVAAIIQFVAFTSTALTVEIQDKATRCLLFFPRIIELVVVSRIAEFLPRNRQ